MQIVRAQTNIFNRSLPFFLAAEKPGKPPDEGPGLGGLLTPEEREERDRKIEEARRRQEDSQICAKCGHYFFAGNLCRNCGNPRPKT